MPKGSAFIALGAIVGAHGIKGAVKLRPFSDSGDDILGYPLQTEGGESFNLKRIGVVKGHILCSLPHIHYRDEAEKLKGTVLGVPRSALPAPQDEGEFYIEDLVGLHVLLDDGSAYGHVKAVYNFGAGDIIEVTCARGDELYSFDEATFPELDLEAQTLTLCPPEVLTAKENE